MRRRAVKWSPDAIFFGGIGLCVVASVGLYIAAHDKELGIGNLGLGIMGLGIMMVVGSIGSRK